MTTSKRYLLYVIDKLKYVEELKYEKENSDYILYSKGYAFGGIYDDMLLLKITKRSKGMIPYAREVKPYENSEKMLHMVELDNRIVLKEIVRVIVEDMSK